MKFDNEVFNEEFKKVSNYGINLIGDEKLIAKAHLLYA